jgi:hypothetical protein
MKIRKWHKGRCKFCRTEDDVLTFKGVDICIRCQGG